MARQFAISPLRLGEREVIDIRDGAGLAVKSLSGSLWVTQADDPDDVVLEEGQSFVLDKPGLALVSAPVGPAVVVIRPAATDQLRRAA